MNVSQETAERSDERLHRVAAAATIAVREGAWWYDEIPLHSCPRRVRPDAIALVRDADGWSQLVPVAPADRPKETLRVWSCHFPGGLDNSGFVGWLATRIKERTGSGVAVV